MRFQRKPYSCGAAAVVNAVRCFGQRVAEHRVRALSSTTEKQGCDEHGIVAALRALGFDGETAQWGKLDDAFASLVLSVMEGHPVIICTRELEHWVTVVGHLHTDPRRVVVIDPDDAKKNREENGVYLVSKRDLGKIWRSKEAGYFGIVCKGKRE